MTGKIVPLRLRANGKRKAESGEVWERIVDFVQPQFSEAELCLKLAAARSPEIIRHFLLELYSAGERFCPALFLTITRDSDADSKKMAQLAASLEALDLALRVHRSINQNDLAVKNATPTTAILAGDFYFSLALTMAGESPIFIKGMAEIIFRVVSSEIEPLDEGADTGSLRRSHLRKISDGYASIMALAATLAGWCSKMEAWQNEALAYFGHYTGMGLQLRREQARFGSNKLEKITTNGLSLPLIYILEHSDRRRELLSLLKRPGGFNLNDERLLRELAKINPNGYIDQITKNCIIKARQYLESLQGSISADTTAALLNFLQIHELV